MEQTQDVMEQIWVGNWHNLQKNYFNQTQVALAAETEHQALGALGPLDPLLAVSLGYIF